MQQATRNQDRGYKIGSTTVFGFVGTHVSERKKRPRRRLQRETRRSRILIILEACQTLRNQGKLHLFPSILSLFDISQQCIILRFFSRATHVQRYFVFEKVILRSYLYLFSLWNENYQQNYLSTILNQLYKVWTTSEIIFLFNLLLAVRKNI